MKLSPAQRRKAAIGPAFQKFYLDDGMTYGAWLAIFAARLTAEISDHRRKLASYHRSYERSQVMQSARVTAKQAKATRLEARSRCPLP